MNAAFTVDVGFPGGNAIIEKTEGNEIWLRQDLRDTSRDWFYWHFRVRGAAGRTLIVHITGSRAIAQYGPAVSLDGGVTWAWAGTDAGVQSQFHYAIPAGADDVRFCVSMPYLQADLERFLARHKESPFLKPDVLCRTAKGRSAEMLHVGRLDGKAPIAVMLTSRHHACEMIGTRVMEGILEGVLSDTPSGKWLRENVEFLAVPFIDKDGAEDGDPGKDRRPYDHGSDYGEQNIYPTTKALKAYVPGWSAGRLRVVLDLHCPLLRGPWNEQIFFVVPGEPKARAAVERYSAILESTETGTLHFRADENMAPGQGWNRSGAPATTTRATGTAPARERPARDSASASASTAPSGPARRSYMSWVSRLSGVQLADTMEIPYAYASGKVVNAESARAFGMDMARALQLYLAEQAGK